MGLSVNSLTVVRQPIGLRFPRAFTIIRIPLLKKGRTNERNFRVSSFRWASQRSDSPHESDT